MIGIILKIDRSSWLTLFLISREIDVFIEKLKSTIEFFTSLESTSSDGADDGFVPFV